MRPKDHNFTSTLSVALYSILRVVRIGIVSGFGGTNNSDYKILNSKKVPFCRGETCVTGCGAEEVLTGRSL